MINSNCPLIFVHIPKTGGMSMFASMTQHHGTQIADMYNMSALDEDSTAVAQVLKNPDIAMYAGHFPFGLHEWLSRPSCYMAIIRSPLERIMSLYYYSIQYRDNILRTQRETGRSLKEQFASGEAADFYLDFIPWIEGTQTLASFLSCQSAELDNGMVRRFSGIGLAPGPCPEQALEMAKENIEKYFSVVGVQERYAETLSLARKTFRLSLAEFHINKGTEKKHKGGKIKMDLRRRIKRMNTLDSALYDWIVERFDRQLQTPSQVVTVPGGGRSDYHNAPLWHAIGSSPLRRAAMEMSPAAR